MIYDGQTPSPGCGPNAHRNPAKVMRIKLTLMIGRRPYLFNTEKKNKLLEKFLRAEQSYMSANMPNTIEPTM